ncbi:hypothetical protein AMS59_22680 [Lysinibacillus sp. FJAT-14745]|uniref:hypothetical protein n=1 Tax=Lysinibacillus sp. FJAT-14745 TaxID=1704289 RepID=UPI0006ABEBFF|nr:hypothetical protein [Lysinibacillus sp. FJAT-14745]KOP69727.1 hypothetical protein AMS59_22680 [Lysinibacillus sp. FJAT-14745]
MSKEKHLEKVSIIDKLEDYAYGNNQNNRVVSVQINKYIDESIQPNYLTTNITIRALDDDIAHNLDNHKKMARW